MPLPEASTESPDIIESGQQAELLIDEVFNALEKTPEYVVVRGEDGRKRLKDVFPSTARTFDFKRGSGRYSVREQIAWSPGGDFSDYRFESVAIDFKANSSQSQVPDETLEVGVGRAYKYLSGFTRVSKSGKIEAQGDRRSLELSRDFLQRHFSYVKE